MRLILIQHGAVESPGQPGSQLTEHGRLHARALAGEIAKLSGRTTAVEAIYTSPLSAARETAGVIASMLTSGSYLTHDAFTDALHEAELGTLQERAWAATEALREEHSDSALLVIVTHELPIRTLVCSALSIPLADMRRFQIDPGSMTTLEFRSQPQRRTILAGLNETCHLTE